MKKSIAYLLVLTLLCLGLCACGEKTPRNSCRVVVAASETETTEYLVDLDRVTGTEGLFSVLEYLKEEKGLEYASYTGDFGAYLTAVGDVKQDETKGEYIGIWTSVTKDQDASDFGSKVTYQSMELVSASVGASTMTVENGAVIYIGKVVYQ